ncbi:hypothetical protein [Mitsuokella sp.]|uniref:hypothetical protein n=1 Tax=Mitsuokella sp. TaxID=2049034 RepID=UPI003D7C9327
MTILYFVVNVVFFLAFLILLEVIWGNTKIAWKEKNYTNLFLYPVGGTVIFVILAKLSSLAHDFFVG